MFTILIQEKGGEQRRMVFNKPEVTIGRVQGNDIVLPKGNVSKRHARIVLKDGKFIIVDLKSTNGTYVNGRKITSPLVVKDSDKIYIGDFIVGVDEAGAEGDGPSETTTSPPGPNNAPQHLDGRPPRPTEAAPMPMPMPMGNPMGNDRMPDRMQSDAPPPMAPPPPAFNPGPGPGPSQGQTLRPGPPRPAPVPNPPQRDPSMPPIAAPAPARPLGGRPGGTMPPPLVPPIPAPIAPPPQPTMAEPQFAPQPAPFSAPQPAPFSAPQQPAPMPMPVQAPPPMAPAPQPAPLAAPAPVVPLPTGPAAQPARGRLVGAGARKVVGRSLPTKSKRGVHLEPLDPKIVKMLDLQSTILERLRTKLDLDKVPADRLHEEDLWQRAERATIDLVETLEGSGELPKYIDQDTLIKETLNEALALGPLEDLFADEKVDEIIIDRRDRVVVGKDGQLRGSGKAFSSDETFERVVKRLVAEAGAVLDDTRPIVDLRMRDGTRLTAALAPVATRGACLVLKKPPTQMPTLADLVAQNALSSGMADFMATCVAARRNVLVCGGPGSGKTQLLAALAAASPAGERVVSVEEISELAIARDEWVQLEARPATPRSPEIAMAQLIDTALRLLPDRIVIGDVRGAEAMTVVTALTSAVDGAVVGVVGEGASTALNRLVNLVRITQPATGDVAATRELVASAFEIVVHVARHSDGAIKVQSVEEVVGTTEVGFETQVVFQIKDGGFAATGTVPRFYGDLAARGIPADQAVFR